MVLKKYEKLLELLSENKNWPLKYMFKFIVENEGGKVDQIVSLLPNNGQLTFNHTENLKYVSVTCVAQMNSAEDIVEITSKAGEIKGVIAL